MKTIRRGLPASVAPIQRPALAATATAEVLTFQRPQTAPLPAGFLDATDVAHRRLAAAMAKAEAEAAKDARLAELEQECSDLRAEVRGLREVLRETEAATAAAVADAERRARHELLGEARQTVAGHHTPSIRPRVSR